MPTLAVVQGAAYGGGLGMLACCDFAVFADDARFCLSEVRLGLLPAVILKNPALFVLILFAYLLVSDS